MNFKAIHGETLEAMRGMADNSFSLIIADPPYYKVKKEAWDNQWETEYDFLKWLSTLCAEWQRLLKPNGSIYVFASPDMAARVEVQMRAYFNVLNHINWLKPNDNGSRRHVAQVLDRSLGRSYFPETERIIFAEHYGAESYAKGEAGYQSKCDELRGFVFEPLRAWFVAEKERLRLSNKDINALLGTATNGSGMAGHYFKPLGAVQWELPTPEHYAKLQKTGGFTRSYESLRQEYEHLRQEYEHLRRPFFLSADVPYTDVWTFPTVPATQDKHICEKPLAMMGHIVRVSSREGDAVLDPFAGSFVVGSACLNLKRDYVGIERDEQSIYKARKLIELGQGERIECMPPPVSNPPLPLFAVNE